MKNCTGIFCPMQYDKVDPATCQAVDYCPQATPPKSNADKIRAMTDEELAEWFTDVCPASVEFSCSGCKFNALECTFLTWLKQEAEL